MIHLYNDGDYAAAKARKKKLLAIYFIVLGVLFAVCLTLFICFLQLPYQYTQSLVNQKDAYLVSVCVVSVLGVIFSVVYLGIPNKRAKYYFRFLDDTKTGDKQMSVSTFVKNDEGITEVGYVDYHTMIVLEWSDKTQEYMRRHVLVDKEKQMPNFKNGDIIKYVTHANCLLSYGLKSEEDVFDEIN